MRNRRRFHRWILPLGALSLGCLYAVAEVPVLAGQVTETLSPADFSVDGYHILCDTKTQFSTLRPADAARVSWSRKPYLGEPLQVYGHEDKKAHSIQATRIVFAAQDPLLRGRGIVDAIPTPSHPKSRLVRADGYRILIDASTELSFAAPLHSLDDLRTNQWIEYQGHLRADGILAATKVHLQPNIVAPREQHLQQKYAYDPQHAAPAGRSADMTGYVGYVFSGRDPKHIPPAGDEAQQQRLQAIGERLIPHYLRELPPDEPAHIDFRFQLIDDRKVHQGIALPNGILLMPREIALRLNNDDQYAAYIASCMAVIIEKQQLRFQTELTLLNAPTVTALAIVQPLTLPVANARKDLVEAETQERVRVALCLLHDAGYNLAEAPKAWWLLASAKKEPIRAIPIPYEATYAYAMLGALWREEIEAATMAH